MSTNLDRSSSPTAGSEKEDFQETIIVGGGMSGIGCAHRLQENRRPFLMITPEIGGRVRCSPDGTVNYGAYYVTRDYQWTLPLVKTLDRVRVTDGLYHRAGSTGRFLSLRMIKHIPAIVRFARDLRRFRRQYNRMNESASEFSRKELIAADSVLQRALDQPGADYIRERGLEGLFADFIDPLLWASFFDDPRNISTFFVLAASLPLIVPMYKFVFNPNDVTEGFQDQIIHDSVQQIELEEPFPRIVTESGRRFRCRHLVMATPMNHTNRLLPSIWQPIRGGIDVSFYHVRGELRRKYQGATRNFFSSDDGAVISRESDGSYLYFYANDQISKYFVTYDVITHGHWRPALFFHGQEFVDAHPAPHVFIASDHDVPSMENAYLNGRYTAKLVLGDSGRGPTSDHSTAEPTGSSVACCGP